jgi:hypothetical protein
MSEKYGVEVFKSALLAIAQVVSVVHEVFIEKKGLWKLFGLQGVVQTLLSLDFGKLKLEVGDLSEVERESVQADFKAALPAALQAKVGGTVDLIEQAIDLGEDAFSYGKHVYAGALALVAKAKLIFGI